MKIIATIIRNGISRGIFEGTKVPEKPILCDNYISGDCERMDDNGPNNECYCDSKMGTYADAIQALWDASVEWEDQEAIKKVLPFEAVKKDGYKWIAKDGIYPLEGVLAEKVSQQMRRGLGNGGGSNSGWVDYNGPKWSGTKDGDKFEYRQILRLIPQPNSEQKKQWPESQKLPTKDMEKAIDYALKKSAKRFWVDEKKEPETRANYMEVARPMKCNSCGYDATTFDFDVSYVEGITYTCRKCKAIALAIGMTFTTTGGVSEGEPNQEELFTELITDIQRMEVVSAIDYAKSKFHIQKLKP